MSDYILTHHGILGQKWGVRRFQNKDGTLTAAGKKRYDGEQVSEKAKRVISDKLAETTAKRKHDFRMKTDPLYRVKNTRKPFDEKPSPDQPWNEKAKKMGFRSDTGPKMPSGTIVDGPQKFPMPSGTIVDGPQKFPMPIGTKRVTNQKQRNDMSEAELDKMIRRLEKEVKLKDLEKRNKDDGKVYTEEILKEVGKRSITTVGTGLALYGMKVVLGTKFGDGLGDAVFRGGAKKK